MVCFVHTVREQGTEIWARSRHDGTMDLKLAIFNLRKHIKNIEITQCKKATIHQLTASKNVLFPGHNHMLTTSTDDPIL